MCLEFGTFLGAWTDTLRVDMLLKDERQPNPNHLGTWHMFLPSDVFLDQMVVAGGVHAMLSSRHFNFSFLRIHAMYSYDESLFRERWLGPPGAAWIN